MWWRPREPRPRAQLGYLLDQQGHNAQALQHYAAALALDPWLTELLEQVSTEWLEVPEGFEGEASLADLEFRARTGASILAVDRGGTTSPNPPPSFAIRAGDRLLVFGGSETVARTRELLGIGASQ